MGKRTFSTVLSLALVAGVFSALPAMGQEIPVRQIPANPNITDDAADANGLTPEGGPAGGVTFSRADILAGWFSADSDSIYAHIQTTAGGRGNYPYLYRVRVDPGAGTTCLWFTAFVPSAVDPSATRGQLRDTCGGDVRTDAELIMENGPEDPPTGVFTIKVPRSAHPSFADGSVLAQPMAEVTQFVGTNNANPQNGQPIGGVTAPVIDKTENGLDYTVGSSNASPAPEPEPTEEPPGKSDPPGKGKKKGCKKGKGKKKGACPGKDKPKPPVAPSCSAYVPGEMGAEAETTVVTDDATEEKPVEIDVPLGPATGSYGSDRTTRTKHNVQIDSKLAEAGFYARLEAPGGDDPDLYVYYASGKQAAVAGGFNPLLVGGPLPNPTNHATINSLNGQGGGGHSEFTAEQIDGLRSPDCQGWTLDLVNWAGRGGTYKLKLWVGEIQNDPAPEQEAESESALDTFFGLLMSR